MTYYRNRLTDMENKFCGYQKGKREREEYIKSLGLTHRHYYIRNG